VIFSQILEQSSGDMYTDHIFNVKSGLKK